jgi:hypothetical protein
LYNILSDVAAKLEKENYTYKSDSRKLILDLRDDLYYAYEKFCGSKIAKDICLELTDEQHVRDAVYRLANTEQEKLISYIGGHRHTQVKTRSQEGQELIRRLFNEIVKDDGKKIDCSDPSNFGKESARERLAESKDIKPGVIYGELIRSEITGNEGAKGQGLRLSFEGGEEIYLSVGNKKSKDGVNVLFPNDGVQFRVKPRGGIGRKKPRVGHVDSDLIVSKKKKDIQDVHTVLENYEEDAIEANMFGKRLFNRINEFLENFFTTNELIYHAFWEKIKNKKLDDQINELSKPAIPGSMVEFSTEYLENVFGYVNEEDNPQGIKNVAMYGIQAGTDSCWLYLCLTATKDTKEDELYTRLDLLKSHTGVEKSYYSNSKKNSKKELLSYIYCKFAETPYSQLNSDTITKEIVEHLVDNLIDQDEKWFRRRRLP